MVVGPRLLAANSFVVDHRRVAALDDNNVNEVVVGVGGANAIDVVERMKKATMHDGTSVMAASVGFPSPRHERDLVPAHDSLLAPFPSTPHHDDHHHHFGSNASQ